MRRCLFVATLLVPTAMHAQFTLQTSGSTASLRGISVPEGSGTAVRGQVAWASGTGGTVLRTLDGGAHWTTCATPPGAERLDFRAVQAFNADAALVMSSGEGASSRVYRTADGCKTWKLVLTNPEAPAGFFDAMLFTRRDEGWILGDPVDGSFYLAGTRDGGDTWTRVAVAGASGLGGGAFAASNQSLLLGHDGPLFGGAKATLYAGSWAPCSQSVGYNDPGACMVRANFAPTKLPLAGENSSSGIFALATDRHTTVAVGGDYKAPDTAMGTAAFLAENAAAWAAPTAMPHGYRSSVAYDAITRTWITVGPNGTDTSTDDGRSWQPLRPDPTSGDAPDADRDWNALALPFVVGPKGRIGRLRPDALKRSSASRS